MRLTDNTIPITGGGSGIGGGLAEALHALGNQVIIAGRRQSALEETAAANPGRRFLAFDQDDAGSIRDLAQRLLREHPGRNVPVNNAGIQRVEDSTSERRGTPGFVGCISPRRH